MIPALLAGGLSPLLCRGPGWGGWLVRLRESGRAARPESGSV